MSTDRDTTRIVRSWLEVGATALPDRVLDAVLDQLPTTPQRRSWGPARRFLDMNTSIKLAIAAAAVVVVAVAGIYLFPRSGGVAAPVPTASPTPSPSPLPSTGTLDAGTYYIPEGPYTPARFSFTVPAGWSTSEGFVYKEGGDPTTRVRANPGTVMLSTWLVSHIYPDVCHRTAALVDVGTTADELARALVAQAGRDASTPTDVMLGGFPAKRIAMTVPADLDMATCDDSIVRFWPDPGPDENGGLCCGPVGSTDVIYVVDVDGKPFAVVVRHEADASEQDLAQLDAIVASVRIDHPAASSLSPSP